MPNDPPFREVSLYIEQEGANKFKIQSDQLEQIGAQLRGPREFSILINGGSFLGVYAEDISKENMGRYGLSDVRGVGVTEVVKDSEFGEFRPAFLCCVSLMIRAWTQCLANGRSSFR